MLIKTGRPGTRREQANSPPVPGLCAGCRRVSMATKHARQCKVLPPLQKPLRRTDGRFPLPSHVNTLNLSCVCHVIQGLFGAHPFGVFQQDVLRGVVDALVVPGKKGGGGWLGQGVAGQSEKQAVPGAGAQRSPWGRGGGTWAPARNPASSSPPPLLKAFNEAL